jgi:hypothetical protein
MHQFKIYGQVYEMGFKRNSELKESLYEKQDKERGKKK